MEISQFLPQRASNYARTSNCTFNQAKGIFFLVRSTKSFKDFLKLIKHTYTRKYIWILHVWKYLMQSFVEGLHSNHKDLQRMLPRVGRCQYHFFNINLDHILILIIDISANHLYNLSFKLVIIFHIAIRLRLLADG